jgi:hypothetical protein
MRINPFVRHGIKSLSPTGLLTYSANPSMWVGKYLLGWKDDAGPRAWLGNAVEAGLHSWLMDAPDFLERARTQYRLKADEVIQRMHGEVMDGIDEAAAHVEPMVHQAIGAYALRKESGVKPLYQVQCKWWIDGIEVPVIGYLDFEWPEQIDDLKTTMAAPSSPRTDHVAQIGMYMRARNKDAGQLVYVTPKKFVPHSITPEQADEAVQSLARAARAIRTLLTTVNNGKQAMALFSPDFSDYRWSQQTKQMALNVLQPNQQSEPDQPTF